jgi:uncharacterized membrane protein YciS (DUF1049 family)
MDLGQRIRLVLAAAVLLVLGALLFAFLVTAFAILLVVGAVLALILYLRLRLFARRVRRALEEARARQQAAQSGPPGESIDADFKVGK